MKKKKCLTSVSAETDVVDFKRDGVTGTEVLCTKAEDLKLGSHVQWRINH